MSLPPPEDFNPYAPPEAPNLLPPPEAQPEDRRPVPFEDELSHPSLWERFLAMLRRPWDDKGTEVFAQVPATDSLTAPWGFATLCSLPQMLLGIAVLASVGQVIRGPQGQSLPFSSGFLTGMGLVGTLLMPLFLFVGILIAGLLLHACLWMWGGLRNGVELGQSIRTAGYAMGYFYVVQLPLQLIQMPMQMSNLSHPGSVGNIPVAVLVGLLGLGLWIVLGVFLGTALARVHRTDRWRGVCAAFTPLALCCCFVAVVGGAAGLLAAKGGLPH